MSQIDLWLMENITEAYSLIIKQAFYLMGMMDAITSSLHWNKRKFNLGKNNKSNERWKRTFRLRTKNVPAGSWGLVTIHQDRQSNVGVQLFLAIMNMKIKFICSLSTIRTTTAFDDIASRTILKQCKQVLSGFSRLKKFCAKKNEFKKIFFNKKSFFIVFHLY